MFKPWIYDEEPKPPKGWSVAIYTGKARKPFTCGVCGGEILFRQEYLYSFPREGVKTIHNNEECGASLIS